MKPVPIGKGMYRIIIKSKAKREKLASIPEIMIDGNRIIFPEWLLKNLKKILEPKKRKQKIKPNQTELF